MNSLSKVEDSDLKPSEIYLARCLIRHHRWAFDTRSSGILNVSVDPPEVRELVNMMMWLANGFGVIDAAEHVLGLQEVITSSADEMKAMLSYIREHGATEPLVREINYLQTQMEAADTLMGYITNG